MRCPRARRSHVRAAPRPGNAGCRRDVDQRPQHECALMHPRMRQRKLRSRQSPAAEHQQVEVEHARRVAPGRALPPASLTALDGAHALEQGRRRERGAQLGHRVDVVGLRLGAIHGGAYVIARSGDEPRARQPRQLGERSRQAPARVPEVAAESDEGDVSHASNSGKRWKKKPSSRRKVGPSIFVCTTLDSRFRGNDGLLSRKLGPGVFVCTTLDSRLAVPRNFALRLVFAGMTDCCRGCGNPASLPDRQWIPAFATMRDQQFACVTHLCCDHWSGR